MVLPFTYNVLSIHRCTLLLFFAPVRAWLVYIIECSNVHSSMVDTCTGYLNWDTEKLLLSPLCVIFSGQ